MVKRENSAEEPTLTKTYINILCMFWSLWRKINSKLKRKKVANAYNQTTHRTVLHMSVHFIV